jgi:Rrf2 family transcriptional regulator, nitric oxide-sensitive transcriptional repressor
MHLTRYSDYSLRVLIFLGSKGEALATIPEIAGAYGISRGHLMKVVHLLGQLGYVETLRGRGGGLRLGMAPENIRIGQVLRQTEESFELVDCFAEGSSSAHGCKISPACKLRGVLSEALRAFMHVLDQYTLADIIAGRAAPLRRLLQIA